MPALIRGIGTHAFNQLFFSFFFILTRCVISLKVLFVVAPMPVKCQSIEERYATGLEVITG